MKLKVSRGRKQKEKTTLELRVEGEKRNLTDNSGARLFLYRASSYRSISTQCRRLFTDFSQDRRSNKKRERGGSREELENRGKIEEGYVGQEKLQ